MSHSKGPGQLSRLAHGHGLLGGGVQVDCFADDRRAFTLTGQAFIKPSPSAPSTVKPYRTHQLALPTTYVTKRGQMVLFTAPEDMIIGSSCHIHKREVTTQMAAKQFKTTRNLMDSALSYNSENDKITSGSTMHTGGSESSSSGAMATGVKAGHFTNVYLNSLQKASQQISTNQSADDCAVEDIEAKGDSPREKDSGAIENLLQGDSDLRLVSECDSGLGHSITPSPSGRISIQSHTSDASSVGSFITPVGHVIRVPDGREVTPSEPRGAAIATPTLGIISAEGARQDSDPLSSLRRELGLQQTNGAKLQVTKSSSKQKSSSKSGKKRHHSKSESHSDSKASEHKTRRKNEAHTDSMSVSSAKTTKSKRKRTRNKSDKKKLNSQDQHQDIDMEMLTVEGALESRMENYIDESKGNLEVTAIQLASSIGSGEEGKDSTVLQKMSRAEERRREVERKRAEKRELERRKREEEERKLKLQEEIEDISRAAGSPEHQGKGSPSDNSEVLAAHGMVTVNQKSLRANLEEMRLKQTRLLLSYQGEGLEKKLIEDMDSAQEAIERAREVTEMEARRQRQREEEEEREREKLKREEEERKRTEAQTAIAEKKAKATASNAKSDQKVQHRDCKCTPHSERPSERTFHTFTGKYMFSYFRYVPPQKSKVDNGKKQKGKRNKRPKGTRSK